MSDTKENVVKTVPRGRPKTQPVQPDIQGQKPEDAEGERSDRTPRELETRASEERIPTTWMPAELLPDPIKEDGYSYRWIRIKYKRQGKEDEANVSARLREGWRPVSPEEQPHIAEFMVDGGRGQSRIVVDEVMLCKIPSNLMEQRAAHYRKKAGSQLEAVHSQLMSHQHASMPIETPSVQTTSSKSVY